MVGLVTHDVFHGIRLILNGIGNAFIGMFFHQAEDAVTLEFSRHHNFGDVDILHPVQPLVVDIQVNFDGDVVEDH